MKQYIFVSTPSHFTYCYNWNILDKTHRWHFLLFYHADISPRRKHSALFPGNFRRWRRIGHLSESKNNWLNFLRSSYISMDQQLSEDKIRHYGSYFVALLDVTYQTQEAVLHHMTWQTPTRELNKQRSVLENLVKNCLERRISQNQTGIC